MLTSPLANAIEMAIISIVILAIIWVVQSFIQTERENTLGDSETDISKTLFILGGIPLVISPCVLFGNIMSIAGEWSGDENVLLFIVVSLFIAVSSSYPFTYLLCWSGYQKTNNKTILIPLVVIIHLVVAILFGILWGIVSSGVST